MKKKLLLTLCLAVATAWQLSAQRYLDDVFVRADIQRQINLVYGHNFYFIPFPPAPPNTSSSNPVDTILLMDVYSNPADVETNRPLVIYLHTGNFLPTYTNGGITGSKGDSATVEMCYNFSEKGYVVAAPNYRLGWNPIAGTQPERVSGLLNAVYRAIHDVQTCVRYFKEEAATYNIDTNRIFVIGQGSAGYVALAYQFLDKQSETELPKFLTGFPAASVINPAIVGDVNGVGGVVNVYNHPGHSNRVAMVANIGGALGDSSWIDEIWPKIPVASIQCRKDLFAPYDSGTVIVPGLNLPVVDVHGSSIAIRRSVRLGLNDIWMNHTFSDPYSLRAYSLNPKVEAEGLFQVERPDLPGGLQEAAPWEWWDSAAVVFNASLYGVNTATANNLIASAKSTNPDMSKAKAIAYIDTIVEFLAPRMYLVVTDPTVGISNETATIDVSAFPNPSSDFITIRVGDKNIIHAIELFDLKGSQVSRIDNISSNVYQFSKSSVASGTYIVKLHTKDGMVTKRVVLQ